jgi:RND family efflux transporter MFP subunit
MKIREFARFQALLVFLTTLPVSAQVQELDCVVEPNVLVELSSRVDGVIDRLFVDRGDRVDAGQVIAKLDSRVEEAAVEQARARAAMMAEIHSHEINVAFGQRNQQRISELHAKKVVPVHDIDRVETETQIARYKLQQAKDNKRLAELELKRATELLNLQTIHSPIRGVVVDRYLNPGESVEDRPIVKLAQIDPLRVEVVAPVSLFGSIKTGQPATVLPELPVGGEYHSTVATVDPVLDAGSGTFRIRLELPNPDYRLTSGLRCKVQFHSQESVASDSEMTGLAPIQAELRYRFIPES